MTFDADQIIAATPFVLTAALVLLAFAVGGVRTKPKKRKGAPQ